MPAPVYRITEVLSARVIDLPIGANLGLCHILWTLGSAAGYALYGAYKDKLVDPALRPYLLLATAAGFVVSFVAMRWLLRYVSTHDFRPLVVYRIVIGLLIVALVVLGKTL